MTTGSVYLPNGYQVAFNCESVVPAKVAIAKASAYAKRRKRDIYVPGIGHFDKDGKPVVPTPPDPPKDKTIGNVTASGDDLTGTNLALAVGAESTVKASFDGDAEDVSFKWTIRTGTAVSIKGDSTNRNCVFVGGEEGGATVRCKCTSSSSSDSPQEVTITAVVSA
jgi:hypothetical protein